MFLQWEHPESPQFRHHKKKIVGLECRLQLALQLGKSHLQCDL